VFPPVSTAPVRLIEQAKDRTEAKLALLRTRAGFSRSPGVVVCLED
jgi:hypothetical protein